MSNAFGVGPTLELNMRVHEALVDFGVTSQLVENPLNEPIAVLLKNVLDPAEVRGSVLLHAREHELKWNEGVEGTLPLTGSMLYPRKFLDILDVIALAAADTDEGLATGFNASTREDNDLFIERGFDPLPFHADFPGLQPNQPLPLHGLNVNYTRWGSVAVILGILRDHEYDGLLEKMNQSIHAKESPDEELVALYDKFSKPRTEPIELSAGDMLIFQARQHADRNLVPVGHRFITTSDTRRSDLFLPKIGDSEIVRAKRLEFATKYALAEWGYDTAA